MSDRPPTAELAYATPADDQRWIIGAARLAAACVALRGAAEATSAVYSAWRLGTGRQGEQAQNVVGVLRYVGFPALTAVATAIIVIGLLLLSRRPALGLALATWGAVAWLALGVAYSISSLFVVYGGWGGGPWTWETFANVGIAASWFTAMPAMIACVITRPGLRRVTIARR